MIRILLADRQEMTRRGMRCLFSESRSDWQVCAEANNGADALTLALEHEPNVAVLDAFMPPMNGFELTRQLLSSLPNTRVLIYADLENDQMIRSAQAVGAHGYLLKTESGERLVAAVEALARGETYFPVGRVLLQWIRGGGKDILANGASQLTHRENEVASMLAVGLTNKEVAAALHIKPNTVVTHREKLMRKLGARTIVDLVLYAVRKGLIEP